MQFRITIAVFLAVHGILSASLAVNTDGADADTVYRVQRRTGPVTVDGNWDNARWRDVPCAELTRYMGKKPDHFPRTQVKLQYDDEALYVIFRVEDRYVRAIAVNNNDAVCTDSCVEFFFSPVSDIAKGYYNLEMNCGGTMLFHCQTASQVNQTPIRTEDIAKIQVVPSLPKRVEPELTEPTTWTVEYRLPFAAFVHYFPEPIVLPAPGAIWHANFYKIGDHTSHPHWLTWAHVDVPQPDFHRPEFFGKLQFE
ncbi:MAG: carbohydrate-binding family 9-like protein [Planctomycetota bacterium]|nr:carbohydrate-binding family 9-like protein [Planctomycetota bacterium]MDA1179301.1 carbohydrate-binding family 9-like protein [Planctomycetota bacterium]